MIIYNVTVKIEKALEEDWLSWMKATHIPDVLKTGLFSEHRICRIMHDDDDGGVTFAIQYGCADMEAFQTYQTKYAKALQADHMERYKDRYVAFRTLMEVV